MTDRNGKPIKVGDKVTYDGLPGQVGTVTATRRTVAVVRFRGTKGKPCHYTNLTLVAPKPEPVGYKADGTPIDLGGISVVTSKAVPKDEAWLVDTAKITEYLATKQGKEILDKVKAPDPVVNALMGKVESQTFKSPLPESDYKGMYEDSRELVRKLTRAAVAVLTAPDGIEKASAYARLREAVKEAL